MISPNDLGKASLDDWVEEFYAIYKDVDRKRSVQDMLLNLVHNGSKVGQAVRTSDLTQAYKQVAHAFCWLATYVAKCSDDNPSNNIERVYMLDKPFREIVWNKYPSVCYRCGTKPCKGSSCPMGEDDWNPDTKLERAIERTWESPPTLDGWVDMFDAIYSEAHRTLSLEYICFHFMEEIGEIADAMRKLTHFRGTNTETLQGGELDRYIMAKHSLEWELADVFSWTCSLIDKVNQLIKNVEDYRAVYYKGKPQHEKVLLSQVLWNEYKSNKGDFMCCMYCGQRPCVEIPL